MKSLKSVFLPKFDQNENPYQNQLAANLEKLEVQVEGTYSLFFLLIVFRGGKADVVHLHWLHLIFMFHYGRTKALKSALGLIAFISQLLILRLMGVKIVWTAHNIKNHEKHYPRLDRICTAFVIKLSDAIIAHCESAKGEVITKFNIKHEQKIFVIPHGNYIDCYENNLDQKIARKLLDLPDSKIALLFLGYIRPYKGVLELIEVFKQLQHEQVQLIIAGKVVNEAAIEVIKHQINGYDSINFVPGFVADEQVQVYMNACDLVIFPYRDIMTSGGVILAMSFSRACVAPRQGCIAEVLDNTGAFLYEPNQEQGLLQAINSAIQSRAKLLRMGEYNRKVAEQWSSDRIAEMTLDVYQKCLSR